MSLFCLIGVVLGGILFAVVFGNVAWGIGSSKVADKTEKIARIAIAVFFLILTLHALGISIWAVSELVRG